jgi:hypothetical protein
MKHKTQKGPAGELSTGDLHLVLQWFEHYRGASPKELVTADYVLAKRVYEALDKSVPAFVLGSIDK